MATVPDDDDTGMVYDLDDEEHGQRPDDPADVRSSRAAPPLTPEEAAAVDAYVHAELPPLIRQLDDDAYALRRVDYEVAILLRRRAAAHRAGERRVSAPRRRERQERHVARATSGADSGDDDPAPSPWPARGLAVCPKCGDEAIVRAHCDLCYGLGYVARELRNRWKRGER
jgi:hypothetical protein